jgi:hypothetical protein
VQARLTKALAPVLRDLETTRVPLPRIEESRWQDSVDGAQSATLWSQDGSGVGIWVDVGVSRAEQIAMVGDQIQEWAFEELAATGRATNWPPCPSHPRNHPLVARVESDRAVWCCPASGVVASELGRVTALAHG